jgi:uncharacterized membrane-anchored protein
MGETMADLLSHGPLGLGYGWASLLLGTLVIIALLLERAANAPNEARYWTTIVIMATAGTTMADFISRTLQFGYLWGTIFLAVLFIGTFVIWRKPRARSHRAKHLASPLPHIDIAPARRTLPATDARYWTAIMVASTLGTTMGDALTNGTKLGFGGGSIVLLSLLICVLIIEYRAHASNEARYWTALVLASTIGATSGDYLSKEEGLNFGYFWGNAMLIVLFVGIIMIGRHRTRRAARTNDHSVLPHARVGSGE